MIRLSTDFKKGLVTSEKGDYASTLKECTSLAEKGDADAQFNLGQIYRQGLSVPINFEIALKWYLLAAEQEDADALYFLGHMHQT